MTPVPPTRRYDYVTDGLEIYRRSFGTIRDEADFRDFAPDLVNAELAHIPLGRFGSVDDVASAIAFLCVEQSAYTSGAVFVIDGASDCV